MSLPVDLHFLLREESLFSTRTNVLEVISKQSIDFFFFWKTKQKGIQNTWRLVRMPSLAFELLFWLIAKVMALKEASYNLPMPVVMVMQD